MTPLLPFLLILLIFAALGPAAARWGADTRESGEWHRPRGAAGGADVRE